MSTAAQIAASQNDSKSSTGPVTEAGKQTVAGNAVRHGLAGSAAHAVLQGEEDAFTQHFEGFMKTYRPADAVETSLVRTLAENYWRLSRAHQMEDALFEQSILGEEFEGMHPVHAQAKAWCDAKKGLQRIALYANRIQRAIDKTTAELKSMQEARKAAYAKAEQEAILLTQLAHAKGKIAEAAAHFPPDRDCGSFVYSLPEVARLIARAAALEEAKSRFFAVAA
jgi:hypothetical protein